MNICLYGASSEDIAKIYFEKIESLAREIAKGGHTLVFGGGKYGLMGAAADGVIKEHGKLIGVAPEFFISQKVLCEECTEFIYTETMRERKQVMEEKSDCFVVAPGGIGTLDEFFEIFTLRTLNRHNKKIAIFSVDGYYNGLKQLLEQGVKEKFIPETVLDVVFFSDDEKEIMEYFTA